MVWLHIYCLIGPEGGVASWAPPPTGMRRERGILGKRLCGRLCIRP